jgi:hypothetical protein
MALQQRGLPAVARVGSAWPEAFAQKRAHSAPQQRTTRQHTDATPPQPPRVRRPFVYRSSVIRPNAIGRPPSASLLTKSIRGYDDVNRSSHPHSARSDDAARYNNHRRRFGRRARALYGGARLRQSLGSNTRSSAIGPAATCNAGRGAATVSRRSNLRLRPSPTRIAEAPHKRFS